MQCNDETTEAPSFPSATWPAVKTEEEVEDSGSGPARPPLSKRLVCDHCRRRRIRCDGQFPCQQCGSASLSCRRDHVPKKRGPKRGHGRVINELRAREKEPLNFDSRQNSDVESNEPFSSVPTSAAPTAPSSPRATFIPWSKSSSTSDLNETKSPFSSATFRPNSRHYFHLIPRCVDLYYEHIYPIMPLLYMPAIRAMISGERPLVPRDKNLIYTLCALTSFHMSGKSLSSSHGDSPPSPSWEAVGRFFLDECISVRRSPTDDYDFIEDLSLSAVISSFWLSTSFFEINQNHKSWYYLREALNLATDLRLQDEASYVGLSEVDVLRRRRVFWILFVTERSFAILRNKPLMLRKTPRLPTHGFDYEAPDIHAGFLKLVSSYVPLDESFVNAWNDGSDPRMSATTYRNLQQILAQPLDFLTRPKRKKSPPITMNLLGIPASSEVGDAAAEEPEPTEIQKADLLMTQQWLRLIVWQSSFRQRLLSTQAADESMTFSFPLTIARDTAAILQSLPSSAVEVHGMGIFEKIFEIGTWCVNVLGAYDSGTANPTKPFGGAMNGVAGMDFAGGDLGILSLGGRGGVNTDPLEFFVKTLSASPNSRTKFAEQLLKFAGETPRGLRTALSPVFSSPTSATFGAGGAWISNKNLVTDITEDLDLDEKAVIDSLNNFDADQDLVNSVLDGATQELAMGMGDTIHDSTMDMDLDLGALAQSFVVDETADNLITSASVSPSLNGDFATEYSFTNAASSGMFTRNQRVTSAPGLASATESMPAYPWDELIGGTGTGTDIGTSAGMGMSTSMNTDEYSGGKRANSRHGRRHDNLGKGVLGVW